MFIFWAIVAILIIASLLFVIPPLLKKSEDQKSQLSGNKETNIAIYHQQLEELKNDLNNQLIDQAQYTQSQEELERRLLEDVDNDPAINVTNTSSKWVAMAALIIIPALSLSLYINLGSPNLLSPEDIEAKTASLQQNMSTGHPDTQASIEEMVGKLEQRMQDNPDDAEGWLMLARSYTFLKRYNDAVNVFKKAAELNPNDPRLLVDYADAIAMATGSSLEGRPIQLITRALEIDPNNEKGLWLAGTAAYDSGDFKSAVTIWARLYAMLEPGSPGASTMAGNLQETRDLFLASGGSEQDIPDIDALLNNTGTIPSVATGNSVSGKVTLPDDLKNNVSPMDTVFIFAKAASGPPMPVAIIRTTVAQLPMEFTLSDAQSVMPARKISQLSQVIVGARISKTGNAMPQSGDIQSQRVTVNTGETGIRLTIDQVIP